MATRFDQHFVELGLTQAQFRILLAIDQSKGKQGVAPSFLAELLLIERGTVSVLTNRMVERGWLMRRPGENRRTYQLVLTETGAALLKQAIPRAIALANHNFSGSTAEELCHLRAGLERVESKLRELDSPDT
jgi:DNA-binding MarR family transcriptional regulator